MNAAVSEKDKPLMREMALRVLDDRLKKSIEIEGQYDTAKNEELAGHAKQIAAVSASLRTFMDETRDDLQALHDTQADLRNQVDQLAGRVDRNSSDIQFLQSFMFDKMSPEEQLGALKAGFFQNMPPADREKLDTKIALIEGRQKLMAAVGAYAEGAATVARIASRVGVDPNVVGVIQKTAQLASVASAVATGFMTGGLGYLAAADAVTGLIIGGGSDAGAERQQQIMQALAQISGQLNEIESMIADVQKGINIIIGNQRQLYDGIVGLSKQIGKDHQDTMAELSLIRRDQSAIKSIANEILNTNIGACRIFQDRLVDDGFSSLTPVPFARLCEHFIDYGAKGLEGLKDRIRNPLESGGYALSRYADPHSPSDNLITMYKRLYDIASRHVLSANLDAYLYAFAIPVTTIAAIDAKHASVLANAKPTNDLFYKQRSWAARAEVLPEPLSPNAIELHLNFLMFCHPFFEMHDELSNRDLEGLLSLKGSSDEGRNLLETGLDLARMALIQHVILSGDVLLGDFDTFWRNGFDGAAPRAGETAEQARARAAPWAELIVILPEQAVLRQNLILYAFSKVIAETNGLLAYSVAYAVQRDPTYLKQLLPPGRFAIEWLDAPGAIALAASGWNIKLGNGHFPLPTPDELLAGRIVTSPYLEALIKLLGRLSGELSGHVVAKSLSLKQQRDFKRAAWGAANCGNKRAQAPVSEM